MSLTKFNESVTNHQSLPDKPTLSSTELKILFDKAGVDIKNYLNQNLKEELDSKESNLRQLIQQNTSNISNMLNTVYPIGSIYMSVNNTNPSTIFGGTWVAWGSGKVPVGVNTSETEFNSVEKIGGYKSENYTPLGTVANHRLTASESGLRWHGHNHNISVNNNGGFWSSEAGAHDHNIKANKLASGGGTYPVISGQGSDQYSANTWANNHSHWIPEHGHGISGGVFDNGSWDAEHAHNHGFSGTQASISHLQPYITCYMWKRTA